MDFDASIKGGHVIPTESSLLGVIVVTLTKISNGTAGSKSVEATPLAKTTQAILWRPPS